MRHLFAIAALGILTACGASNSEHHDNHAAMEKPLGKSVVVSNAQIRPPLPGQAISAAYFDLINKGEDNRLVDASSDIAGRVEIHTVLSEDGVMRMRRIEGIDLPAGETVYFKPRSHHLMMFDVNMPEDAKDGSLTLTFENGETLTVIADITDGMDDDEDHSGH